MALLQEGTHVVFVKDAIFTETKAGHLAVRLTFGTHLTGDQITWTGTFSTPKAMEYTLGVLKTCGLKSIPDDIATQGAHAFDGRDVEIVVEKVPGNEPGKFFTNVKWVNPVGGKKAADSRPQLSSNAAIARLAQLGVGNTYKAMKAQEQAQPTFAPKDLDLLF
jgi:hypothetical protein